MTALRPSTQLHPDGLADGNVLGLVGTTYGPAQAIKPVGLTGATNPTRYVGGTTTGHPTSGTFVAGDYVVTADGHVWVCTVGGSPGTWVDISGSGGYATVQDEGTALTTRTVLDFVGSGIQAVDDPNGARTIISAAAGASTAAETAPSSNAAFWLPVHLRDVSFSTLTADRSLMLSPSATWESGAVDEPNVWYAGGSWWMLYTGGWTSSALGVASAPSPLGPWTKYASNPVIGNGAGGMATTTSHANVYVEGGTAYCYYPTANNGGNIKVATASAANPTSWTTVGTVLSTTATATGIVNTSLFKRGTNDYVLMFESTSTSGPQWQIGYATGTSPTGTFTVQSFPLTTLQHSSGVYGGPYLDRQGSLWVLVYHASTSGSLPTDIYRATSTDLVTWTQDAGTYIGRVATHEVDQVADFFYATDSRGGYGFWSGMDNTASAGYIYGSDAITPTPPEWYDGKNWHYFGPTIQDEGVALASRAALDFVGTGVSAVDDSANNRTTVNISAGVGELLMTNGVTNPPVPLTTEDGTDWLYQG